MTDAQVLELVCVAISFAVFLVGVGIWQANVDRSERERTVREIRESERVGSNRALTQHPQIRPELCIGCASCVRACPESGVLGLVDGVAHVIHGSRCIGHGRCEEACPVGALVVGLGELANSPDTPTLSDSLETTVPGIYIAGELGGIALIRNAVEQGARAMEAIAARSRAAGRELPREAFDVLIVGAGPAGISASLKAVETRLRYLTISQDDLGGTVRHYPRRKLTLTQPMTLPLHGRLKRHEYRKEQLITLWEGLRRRYKLRLKTGVKLVGIEKVGDFFKTETSAGVVVSRFVLLALGRRGTPRKLGVPGEETEKVFYRLIDAATYRDEHLLVVGGGDSAIEAATALANQPGNVVTLSYRKGQFFRLKARNQERIEEYAASGRVRVIFDSDVAAIEPDEVILRLKGEGDPLDGESTEEGERRIRLPNRHVFVFAGGVPPFPILREAGIGFGGAGANVAPTVELQTA